MYPVKRKPLVIAAAGLALAEGPAGLARADDLTLSNGRLTGTVLVLGRWVRLPIPV